LHPLFLFQKQTLPAGNNLPAGSLCSSICKIPVI